jgi:hypothetical protein
MRVGDIDLLVETTPVAGSQQTGRIDTATQHVADAFARAQAAIVEIASSTVDTIRRSACAAAHPDEVKVEFGVKFSAKGDVIVAGVAGEATLKVTLTYRASAAESPGSPTS